MAADWPFPSNGPLAGGSCAVERAVEAFDLARELRDTRRRFRMPFVPCCPALLLFAQDVEAVIDLVLGCSEPGALRAGE